MKNIFWLPTLLLVCGFIIGCKKDENKNCTKNVSISAVQPNTNPAGYEVLLKTSGFTDSATVVFGSVTATTRAGGAAGDIIAKVPAGLSGNVEISVEEGDCIARSGGFVVSGSLPSGVQPSLPQIIVPVPSTTLPESVGNFWRNAIDSSQAGINIQGNYVGQKFILNSDEAYEFDFNNPYFDRNPATGTIDTISKVIYLEVNRTAKGGTVEHFDGQFIVKPTFLPAAAAQVAILLVSRDTGRQLLLYYQI